MPLTVEISEKTKGVMIVALNGALDTTTYQVLQEKLQGVLVPASKVLILDLEKLQYISSMGISVVLKARKYMEEHQGSFVMVNLQPQIQAVFDIVNALPSTQIFKNLAEADAYLSAMQRKVKARQKQEEEERF
ncbi:MAG: STAS domain-containing protein [Candidatus Omnitrophica bacterium]|nr:STAS domain-containing protein [Candidatus Omnitrophota bacterium]